MSTSSSETASPSVMAARSLNGGKTRPLTAHALSVLGELASRGPAPTQTINPGVVDRFHREELTETVDLPSPYAAHKGGTCRHERITEAGRTRLGQR